MRTTLRDLAFRMEARGVFQALHKVAKETLPSARVFSSTMRGLLRTMTAEETLQPATGSRLCLHSKSRKSSTPSKWYETSNTITRTSLTRQLGNGGPRALQTSHPFLLMIMHSSFGHGVLAKTFEVCACALGQQHLRADRQLTSMFWVLRTCLFYLSEHLW
jgi:hypothetical protein